MNYMTITLYTTKSDKRELEKALSNSKEISAELLAPTDIITPRFKLVGFDSTHNYLYVPNFSRYYYITDISYELGGYVTIACSCDVLMSFADDIKKAVGLISRGGANANVLINDDATLPQVNTATVNKLLSGGELLATMTAENQCFALSVYGASRIT